MDKGWELYQMYDVVEHTIDYAFKGKFMLNMYEYLKSIKATKRDVEEFINSPTALEINTLILDLEDYMEGGNDSQHKQLREAYGHLGKPEARKIRNYLYEILQDAWKYEQEKKPGRKRKRPSK
jgi:hypothetical protein